MTRTRVTWKCEAEEDWGPVGPVSIETFGADPRNPERVDSWDQWVPQWEAAGFARARGYEFCEA